MPSGRGEQHDGWADSAGLALAGAGAGASGPAAAAVPAEALSVPARLVAVVGEFVRQVLAVAEAEARKLRHDPTELLTRAVQPTLWLVVFGQVMGRIRAIPTGDMRYIDFMAPGVLAQSVLFIAIFYGISLIWERDLGVLHKYMVSPAYRGALVFGKALSAGIRGLTQAFIVYLLAVAMGVRVRLTPVAIGGVLLSILLGAAIFSTFSLVVACVVKTRERFMGIGQVLTMPLFFASNAIYPLSVMPAWLKGIAHVNPLTYQVDALRALMVQGARPPSGWASTSRCRPRCCWCCCGSRPGSTPAPCSEAPLPVQPPGGTRRPGRWGGGRAGRMAFGGVFRPRHGSQARPHYACGRSSVSFSDQPAAGAGASRRAGFDGFAGRRGSRVPPLGVRRKLPGAGDVPRGSSGNPGFGTPGSGGRGRGRALRRRRDPWLNGRPSWAAPG